MSGFDGYYFTTHILGLLAGFAFICVVAWVVYDPDHRIWK
jgi:hypothetical protein